MYDSVWILPRLRGNSHPNNCLSDSKIRWNVEKGLENASTQLNGLPPMGTQLVRPSVNLFSVPPVYHRNPKQKPSYFQGVKGFINHLFLQVQIKIIEQTIN